MFTKVNVSTKPQHYDPTVVFKLMFFLYMYACLPVFRAESINERSFVFIQYYFRFSAISVYVTIVTPFHHTQNVCMRYIAMQLRMLTTLVVVIFY